MNRDRWTFENEITLATLVAVFLASVVRAWLG